MASRSMEWRRQLAAQTDPRLRRDALMEQLSLIQESLQVEGDNLPFLNNTFAQLRRIDLEIDLYHQQHLRSEMGEIRSVLLRMDGELSGHLPIATPTTNCRREQEDVLDTESSASEATQIRYEPQALSPCDVRTSTLNGPEYNYLFCDNFAETTHELPSYGTAVFPPTRRHINHVTQRGFDSQAYFHTATTEGLHNLKYAAGNEEIFYCPPLEVDPPPYETVLVKPPQYESLQVAMARKRGWNTLDTESSENDSVTGDDVSTSFVTNPSTLYEDAKEYIYPSDNSSQSDGSNPSDDSSVASETDSQLDAVINNPDFRQALSQLCHIFARDPRAKLSSAQAQSMGIKRDIQTKCHSQRKWHSTPCDESPKQPWSIERMWAHQNGGSLDLIYEDEAEPQPKITTKDEKWIDNFIASRGNEYFCDIDEDYLTDKFNLTGLNTEVTYYQHALDLVTDVFDLDCDDDMRDQIEKSARHLYGLVHARYITTTRGLQKMAEKFKKGDFGKCPRVACEGQPLLPCGQHDNAGLSSVKLYCARCEDLYKPKSSKHSAIDGAYFGTSFAGIAFQVYPQLLPARSQKRYEPKIYGFRVHSAATLARWQAERREEMKDRLIEEGTETGFEREEREMEDMEAYEEGGEEADGIDDMFEGRRLRG